MSKRLNRFLIVDLAEDASRQFSRLGRRLGYSTETALAPGEFLLALRKFNPTVVMMDLQSVDNGGIDNLKALRDCGSDAHVVLTGDANDRALETARQLAEFLGLAAVASPRSSIFVNILRNELRKARQSLTGLTVSDLGQALANGDIRAYYQPAAACRAHRGRPVTEVEALPRWHLSESRVVMPEDFAWLAEDGGLMPAITDALLEQVIPQMADWQARKVALSVAVNLAASSLVDRTLPERLLGRVQAAGLEPSRLTLEVTEASAMNYPTSAIDGLSRLKSMGFRLSVDEFGTSYSSLEQIYRLKFDELKIDPSLVLESRICRDARTIIEATVVLAQKLGLTVCADGVDSRRTLEFLSRIGCNKAQGNFISRPLHARMLEDRLNEWNVPAGACQASRPAHRNVRRPAFLTTSLST